MNRLKNISLKIKMLGGLSLILGTTLTVVLHIVEGSKFVKDQISTIIDTSFPSMELSNEIIDVVEKTNELFLNAVEELEDPAPDVLEEYLEQFSGLKEKINLKTLHLAKLESWHLIEKHRMGHGRGKNPEDSITALYANRRSLRDSLDAAALLLPYDTLLSNIRENYSRHHENITYVIQSAMQHDGLAGLPDSLLQLRDAGVLMGLIQEFRSRRRADFSEALQSIYQHANSFSLFTLSSGIFLLLIIIFILLMTENIFKSLARIILSAKKLSTGQSNITIDLSRRDELGQINIAFERLRRQKLATSSQVKTGKL